MVLNDFVHVFQLKTSDKRVNEIVIFHGIKLTALHGLKLVQNFSTRICTPKGKFVDIKTFSVTLLGRKSKTQRPNENEMGKAKLRETVCKYRTQQFPEGVIFQR